MWVSIITSSVVNMTPAGAVGEKQDNLHSLSTTKDVPSTCNIDSVYIDTLANQSIKVKIDKDFPASLEYFNDDVKRIYNSMRDKVISHVKAEVISSLFSLNVNGFAPENIAAYVSDATKSFLPFKFANGVKIIDVTHNDETIVYKAEIPTHKNHNHALLLTNVTVVDDIDTIIVNIDGFNLLEIGHSYFAEAEGILHDMFDLLRHDNPPEKRQRPREEYTETGDLYWLIKAS